MPFIASNGLTEAGTSKTVTAGGMNVHYQDDRGLKPVCVLILVDKDVVKATTDIEAWIVDAVSPVDQEVVVIEHILTLFGCDIRREQLPQLGFPS